MKSILLFIIYSFVISTTAQNQISIFLKDNNISIPIYKQPNNYEILTTIMNDTIFEQYYSFTILENSPLMFYVNIENCSQYNSPSLKGWIEKQHCGVYIDSNNDENSFKLYNSPNEKSSYIKLFDIDKRPVTVIDYKDKWLKIKMIYKNKLYLGWINKYCPNIYNSCT